MRRLADANRLLGHPEEGIHQVEEALEIHEGLGNTLERTRTLITLAWLLFWDGQSDKAEKTTARAIDLLKGGNEPSLCQSHRLLGNIYHSKANSQEAIRHYETALVIASQSNLYDQKFWVHHCIARVFCDQDQLDDAQTHITQAKQCIVNNKYLHGRAAEVQAQIWYQQGRIEDARSEALRATEVLSELGAVGDMERCRDFLRRIPSEK